MSGGHYNYAYRHLEELADSIEGDFLNGGKYTPQEGYSEASEDADRLDGASDDQRAIILKEVAELIQGLRGLSKRGRELEWYLSGDTGHESYLARLDKIKSNK